MTGFLNYKPNRTNYSSYRTHEFQEKIIDHNVQRKQQTPKKLQSKGDSASITCH
jgi:hypothetical protein